jgi:ribonuclease-3
VNAEVLAEVAEEIDIGADLRLGKGEDASGGREKPSILSDAMEAVIGAVYIDGGWEAAAELVMRLLGTRITEGAAGPGGHDYKTRLQELSARTYDELPRYHHVSEGPDHAKRFSATVSVNGDALGRGDGRSKKQAEQAAARMAWERLSTVLGPAAVARVPDDPIPDDPIPDDPIPYGEAKSEEDHA